uniref:Germinal-center associated nuclear protein n=1 Tax=Coturnix japonica TaxID=93934 RepID=A0A8C2YBY4_COTJA
PSLSLELFPLVLSQQTPLKSLSPSFLQSDIKRPFSGLPEASSMLNSPSSQGRAAAMNAGGPFRGPPAFPPPSRFGQSAAPPFVPYGLGQAAGNAAFSFKPPTNLGGLPAPGDAAGGTFAPPEFRFKAPDGPAAFTFSPPFGFAPDAAGPEPPAPGGAFSFSRPAPLLGRPEEGTARPHSNAGEEAGEAAPKGLKRKEERERSPRRMAAGGRAAAPPEKRAVLLSRPRGGALFGRTLQEVLRSQGRERGEPERGTSEEPAAEGRDGPYPARLGPADGATVTPARTARGNDSTDSLGGASAAELTAIQCKNVPDYLNDRTVLEKHFGQFVKVRRVMTRRNKKTAVVHFFDHASAALAKKKAKELHKDVVAFWQKKKTSKSWVSWCAEQAVRSTVGNGKGTGERGRVFKACSCIQNYFSAFTKPGLRKALQFEVDLFDSGSEGQNSEAMTSLSSLSNLVGLVAETSEERYRLLDQRDKIMRQARIKRTDLGKAKTIVGTCPDMCPEKERYMRETRNQLSVFEVLLGSDKVNHAAAIKEYSRSSADQEEPLPHELRPSEVLSMTMDYLVTNIMDQGEGNYREWYDFVWNRTRGIRKDITQQHLCNPLMVSLIEKCTRFHIHCAHHLCEEPMSSFDAKINNENMTKCLQSLKEMYQDLANKGIYCESEAEFRGYSVLLNLNKGDILREVQQFHPEVRNSPEVRFAVQAFAALNSNNFVRFFKLVQAASYLNACLLHCYFNQIRKDALKSLNIAYTVSTQRCTVFPLDHLVRMLLFKDCEEATDFISYYGLSVSDGTYVELNRSAFLEPDGLPKPRKSLFVSQKLTVSVGEVVNGGPLPLVPHHVPVSSFNGQSKYIGGIAAGDQAGSNQKSSMETAGKCACLVLLRSSCFVLQSRNCSLLDIAEVVDGLVHDVVKGECREVGRAGADYVTAAICRCALERDQQARIARCSEEVCGHVMDLFLEDEIFQIAKETIQELQCFCKYLQRWREAVAARTKLKRQMRAFPAAPCCMDPKNKLKALSPSAEWPITMENLCKRIVNMGNGGKLGVSCTRLNWLRNKTVHEIKVQHFYRQLLSDLAWTPLDLASLVAEHIPVQQEQVFWKVLLVLPNDDEYAEDDSSRTLMKWLKAKFMKDKSWKNTASCAEDRIQTLTLFNSSGIQGSRNIRVSVCVKVVNGVLSDSELDASSTQKDLLGTSGLILLLPPRVRSDDVAEEDVYWLSALLQLKQLLQVKPFQPIVPLLVLVPSQEEEATEKEVEEGLMLQDLISAQLISDYVVIELPGSINDLEAVSWLVSQCPNSLELCSQTLQEYIEDGIDGEFGKRFYHDWRERRLAGLPSQEPGVIIELYNCVLQFLSEVASSEHLCDLSWPVTEFSERGGNKLLPHLQWNMPDHLAWLKKAVLSFQIPYLDLPPLGAPWRPVCRMIFQYASQIASSSNTQPLIHSQVENLLSKTYQKWKNGPLGSSGDGPSVDEIPWDDILATCIDHKLRDWKPPKLPVAPEAVSEEGQIRVYFFKEHLKNFIVPFSWEQARLRTREEIRQGHKCEASLELSMGDRSPVLSDRLKHLQRLLRANKEGEVASELHLSALMDMVDI